MLWTLRALLGVGGAITVGVSFLHIAFGPSVIPGSIPVNATMDSEDRFYAVMFLAYGAVMLWTLRGLERKLPVVRFLAAVLFVGGLARIISLIAVGLPHPFFVAMTIVELVLPPVIVFITMRVRPATADAAEA
ncbi:MAG: DUF4345 domain-containing protein [Alphaproteobacteria bacterium]|nr:DUF4345 domain-containing protein [Alphaproteobacteria bacterium]